MCLKFSSNIYHSNTGYYESKYSAGTTNESSKNKVKVRINKKILEYRKNRSLPDLVPGGEDKGSRRRAGMNIGNSIHRASGRTIRSDASYAIAGWPCANLAYHSNSSRENGGGDERKRAANAFLRVSYHRVTKRVCHTIRSREPRISIFFSRDHFPDSQQFSFSFQRNRRYDCFSIERIEDQMLSMLDKLFEKGRKFEVRIHERGNL